MPQGSLTNYHSLSRAEPSGASWGKVAWNVVSMLTECSSQQIVFTQLKEQGSCKFAPMFPMTVLAELIHHNSRCCKLVGTIERPAVELNLLGCLGWLSCESEPDT